MEGLKQLFETANIIRENFYPNNVRILGLLLTFVENTTIFSRQIQQQMREFFGSLVFDTVIHKTVRLAEAPSAGEPVLTYAPKSRGTEEYRALADEIINGRPLASEKMSDDETAEEKISAEKVMVEETSNDEATVEQMSNDETVAEQTSDDEATVEQMSNDETAEEKISAEEVMVEEMNDGKE
jgi:nitrogenase subunit NifH